MKKRLPILLIIVLFSCFSCRQQESIGLENLEYVGNWSSNQFYLEIALNGRGYWQGGNNNLEGTAGNVFIENNEISFIAAPNKTFSITQPPFLDSTGYTVMTLDNELFYKH